MAPTVDLGQLPSRITGSCLCKKIAYRIDFPEKHDFTENVLFVSPQQNLMSWLTSLSDRYLSMYTMPEEHIFSLLLVPQGPILVSDMDHTAGYAEEVLLH